MTQPFLPEGKLRDTKENQELCASREGLRLALEQNIILEGTALLCDESHDLMVKLGDTIGRIPRDEAAVGIAEGTTKEIAILSRVGKPVCFTIESLDEMTPLLSRRRPQEMALSYMMASWRRGDVVPAMVTHLEPFGAFVDIGCGVPSLLSLEQISASHIRHPNLRFHVGQELRTVVSGLEPERGRVHLSYKVLLGTWEENASLFSHGITVPGFVRGIKSYGIFVEMMPNLSGLAEPYPGLEENERVSVYLKSIQPERHKIKLLVIDRLPPDREVPPPRYFFQGDHLEHWSYFPNSPENW